MDVREIYNRFYDVDHCRDHSRMDSIMHSVMEQIKAAGMPVTDQITVEEQLCEMLVLQQEESFADGFSVGVDHILGAAKFAHNRMMVEQP